MVEQLSLTVEIDESNVKALHWIHGCFDWGSGACLTDPNGNKNCYSADTCTDCNPSVFVTYEGDAGVEQMMSISYRFDQYENYDITSYYQNAVNL